MDDYEGYRNIDYSQGSYDGAGNRRDGSGGLGSARRQGQEPKDPFKGRRGPRGGRKFCFTYKDLSEETGISINAIQSQVARGKFDPDDLKSLCYFVIRNLAKRKPVKAPPPADISVEIERYERE